MKKIAVGTVKAFLKENQYQPERTVIHVGDTDVEVTLSYDLTVEQKGMFTRRVMSGCFDELGRYRPESYSAMFKATVLQMCSDLPTLTLSGEKMDDGGAVMDINDMARLFDLLNICDTAAYKSFLTEMSGICAQAIEWRKQLILAREAKPDSDIYGDVAEIVSHIKSFVSKLDELSDGMDAELFGKMNQLLGAVTEAAEL